VAPANTQPTDDRELDRDRVSVVRGALVNVMGHLLRLAEPLLTLAVVRLYGEAVWGHFILAESIAYFGTRVATLGLDKGMLWSISRSRAEGGSYSTRGLHGGLVIGVTTATVIAALGWLFSESLVLGLFTESGAVEPTQIIL
jgi:O-antigen/teichoic acid export membrane protein